MLLNIKQPLNKYIIHVYFNVVKTSIGLRRIGIRQNPNFSFFFKLSSYVYYHFDFLMLFTASPVSSPFITLI